MQACSSAIVIACCTLAIRTATASEPKESFRDDFQHADRYAYRIQRETDGTADEYGNTAPDDAAEVFFLPRTGCLYVEAADNDSVTISRDVGAVTAGVLTVRFKPLALYPANGTFTLSLRAREVDSGYVFGLAGGHYETPLRKRVCGRDAAGDTAKGPYFSTMDEIGGYNGEMTARWPIQNPQFYTVTLKFSPDRIEAFLDGRKVREAIDSDRTPLHIIAFSIRVDQMERLIDAIEFRPFLAIEKSPLSVTR